MGAVMIGYRVYFINRIDNRIEQAREFIANDDNAAIQIAGQWRNGQPMELWQEARKVMRWEASSPQSPNNLH